MRYKVLSILTLAVLSMAATSPAIMPGQDDASGAFGGVGKVMITDLGGYSFQRGTAFAI